MRSRHPPPGGCFACCAAAWWLRNATANTLPAGCSAGRSARRCGVDRHPVLPAGALPVRAGGACHGAGGAFGRRHPRATGGCAFRPGAQGQSARGDGSHGAALWHARLSSAAVTGRSSLRARSRQSGTGVPESRHRLACPLAFRCHHWLRPDNPGSGAALGHDPTLANHAGHLRENLGAQRLLGAGGSAGRQHTRERATAALPRGRA